MTPAYSLLRRSSKKQDLSIEEQRDDVSAWAAANDFEIVQEFADLLAVIATAAADNQITHKESQQIRARWEELKSVTESFVTCCEEGNFLPLKEKQPSFNAQKP